jgi:hypothetical protein
MRKKDMTVKEFAEKMEVTYTTAIRWLNRGIVPNAYREELLPGLAIWRIPPEALRMKPPKSGPKPGGAKKGSAK